MLGSDWSSCLFALATLACFAGWLGLSWASWSLRHRYGVGWDGVGWGGDLTYCKSERKRNSMIYGPSKERPSAALGVQGQEDGINGSWRMSQRMLRMCMEWMEVTEVV